MEWEFEAPSLPSYANTYENVHALPVEHMVYFDDYLMEEIIGNIRVMKRMNLELASKRLRHLSVKTPCFIGEKLQLYMEYNTDSTIKVTVQYKNKLCHEYRHIGSATFTCSVKNPDDTFKILSSKFKRSIVRIECDGHIFVSALRSIMAHFPFVKEIDCTGFSKNTCSYLISQGHQFTKQITKITLGWYYLCNQTFNIFNNINSMTIAYSDDENLQYLKLIKGKLKKISLSNIKTPKNLMSVSSKCERLSLSAEATLSFDIKQRLYRLDNIHSLHLIFGRKNEEEIAKFIQYFTYDTVHKLKLEHLRYNSRVLREFASRISNSSTLSEVYMIDAARSFHFQDEFFFNFYDDNFREKQITTYAQPIITIFPKTLKKLWFYKSPLNSKDFENIVKYCPNLEEITIIYKDKLTFSADDISQMIMGLKNLKRFTTNIRINTKLISYLIRPDCNIRSAQFNWKCKDRKIGKLLACMSKPADFTYYSFASICRFNIVHPMNQEVYDQLKLRFQQYGKQYHCT